MQRLTHSISLGHNYVKRQCWLASFPTNFFDQGNFEAMKTLSGWEAARCDEHRFRARIKVSTRAVLEF